MPARGRGLAILLFTASMAPPVLAGGLPDGLVYLADIAPAIRQDIRYASGRNFTGARVPGYRAAECVLAREAALALRKVDESLAAQGFGLAVLDCYRPRKAVRHFVRWAAAGGWTDPAHHPRIARSDLVDKGYIAARSSHSTGFTVDATLADRNGAELDMGTPFDFFDPRAHTASRAVSPEAMERRRVLVRAMAAVGFVNYRREWWHFSLKRTPAAAPIHDIDIVPRGG